MVVACPACHTRYRVNGSVTLAGETSFECSQEECKHIFVYNPPVLWKGNTSSDIDPPADPPIPDSPSQQEPASQNEAKQSPQAEASRPTALCLYGPVLSGRRGRRAQAEICLS